MLLCVFCFEVMPDETPICVCGEYKGLMPLEEGIGYIGGKFEDYADYLS